jgi:RecB family endonuclease NucS
MELGVGAGATCEVTLRGRVSSAMGKAERLALAVISCRLMIH